MLVWGLVNWKSCGAGIGEGVLCLTVRCSGRFGVGFVNPEHSSAFRRGRCSLHAPALLIHLFLLCLWLPGVLGSAAARNEGRRVTGRARPFASFSCKVRGQAWLQARLPWTAGLEESSRVPRWQSCAGAARGNVGGSTAVSRLVRVRQPTSPGVLWCFVLKMSGPARL